MPNRLKERLHIGFGGNIGLDRGNFHSQTLNFFDSPNRSSAKAPAFLPMPVLPSKTRWPALFCGPSSHAQPDAT